MLITRSGPVLHRMLFAVSKRSMGSEPVKPAAAAAGGGPTGASTAVVEPLKKQVFMSQSNDVFSNLALEDWLYKQGDFSNARALLLWRNAPCVVIGRHQNPWVEASGDYCAENRVPIARRNSGGGTVYHDMGNLNCTFFTSRADYDRKANLEVIRAAVWDTYGLDLIINKRDDIEWRGQKVSGTAAKLGREVAYHHCTVLVHSDRNSLHKALQAGGSKAGFDSKATVSVPAQTACLREAEPSARVTDVMNAIGRSFLENPVVDKRGNTVASESAGYQLINPTDYWFPGLDDLRRDLTSWEWVYGKTPNFAFTRQYSVPIVPVGGAKTHPGQILNVSVTVTVSQGLVTDTKVTQRSPDGLTTASADMSRVAALKGQRFTEHLVDTAMQRTVNAALNSAPVPFGSPRSFGTSIKTRLDAPYHGVDHHPMEREYVNSILTCA